MPYASQLNKPLILTVGCVIDLLGTDMTEQIIGTIPEAVTFLKCAYEENIPVRFASDRDSQHSLRTLLSPFVEDNRIQLTEPSTDAEWLDYYRYALGRPHTGKRRNWLITCLLAVHRDWIVAGNDLATIRFLDDTAPRGSYVSSIDLIWHWASITQADSESTARIIRELRSSTWYHPPPAHPRMDWWQHHCDEAFLEDGE